MNQAVEQSALLPRFFVSIADDDEAAGQDLDVIGVAAEALGAALDVGVIALRVGEAPAAGSRTGRMS